MRTTIDRNRINWMHDPYCSGATSYTVSGVHVQTAFEIDPSDDGYTLVVVTGGQWMGTLERRETLGHYATVKKAKAAATAHWEELKAAAALNPTGIRYIWD